MRPATESVSPSPSAKGESSNASQSRCSPIVDSLIDYKEFNALCLVHRKRHGHFDDVPRSLNVCSVSRSPQETKMNSTKSKIALALGVVGALVVSVASADARTVRKHRVNRDVLNSQNYQPNATQPAFRRSFNFLAPQSGGGINYRDGRNGANWNPNQ
jgi:hypothetical protein